MKARIDITTAYFFPLIIRIVAVGLIVPGVALLFAPLNWWMIGLLLILLSLFVLTARYRLSINLVKQTYHDHLWIAGFEKGEKNHFDVITGMFVNQNAYTQTVNSRASSMTKHGIEYNGYIRFDEEDVHVLSDDSKKRVMRKMKKIQEALKGNIVSSTTIQINSDIADYTKVES